MLVQRSDVGEFRQRYRWLVLVAIAAFGTLIGRLVQLQLENGSGNLVLKQDAVEDTGVGARYYGCRSGVRLRHTKSHHRHMKILLRPRHLVVALAAIFPRPVCNAASINLT